MISIACAVSNGSLKNGCSTSARATVDKWTSIKVDHMFFVNSGPGLLSDHSLYQNELAAIVGILYVIKVLIQDNNNKSGIHTIALNGQKALDQTSYWNNE